MALGKHKYYCEMCQKQCKDDNAYVQHKKSGFHLSKMGDFNSNPRAYIQKYSADFESEFLSHFKVKYGPNQWVIANKAYNEVIRDPHHTHLNSTRWTTLGEFIMYLSTREHGIKFEKKREVINGIDSDLLMWVDLGKEKEAQMEAEKKEMLREHEKKREQKDLDKRVKLAQKIEAKEQASKTSLEIQGGGEPQGMISFSFEQVKEKPEKAMIFSKEDQSRSLFGLEKPDKTANRLQHALGIFQKEEELEALTKKQDESKQWVKKGMIVKIKNWPNDLSYEGEKARVSNISSTHIYLDNNLKMPLEMQAKALQNVVPGNSGSTVMVIKTGKIGVVKEVSSRDRTVTVRIKDDQQILSVTEVCKFSK